VIVRAHRVNYARRQQYRRLSHAGKAALGSVVAGLLGLAVASAGAAALGGLLLLMAVGLGLYARHWLSLAGRSRVGARSEDEVQRALAPLQAEGWRLRHSLPWQGSGDIDSVAIAPTRPGARSRHRARASGSSWESRSQLRKSPRFVAPRCSRSSGTWNPLSAESWFVAKPQRSSHTSRGW
jgi:hypothetical protein